MSNGERMAIRVLDLAATACLLVLGVTIYGHTYRYSIEEQLETWNDGTQTFIYDEHPSDTFDPNLYDRIRSVADATAYIRSRGDFSTEEELLQATYDLVRSRYIHYMYPHHTWLTNPALAFLEFVAPGKRYDTMIPADVVLRHAAAAPCGAVATTFVEVHRALGGKAQFVSFYGGSGHQVAEVIADGKKFFVDVDLEAIAPFGAIEFAANEDLISRHYSHRSPAEIEQYSAIFSQQIFLGGYEGIPSDSPLAYRGQVLLERGKLILPAAVAALCIVARARIARRGRRDASIQTPT